MLPDGRVSPQDATRMTLLAPCARAARRARTLLAAIVALLLAAGCTRLPTDAAGARARAAGSLHSDSTGHPMRAIAMLTHSSESDSVAKALGSEVLDVIPELSLALFRTPTGMTADAFVQRLAGDPRVVFSEPDAIVETAEGSQSTVAFSEAARTWGDVVDQTALSRIGVAAAQHITRGAGALVAILDTGIDLDHPVLAGAIDLPGIEPGVVTDPGDDRPEALDTNGDGVIDGSLGHGTHVAGLVHAVAPDARLLAVRVLDSDGVGDAFRVAQGIVAAVERGADVVNLSLGLAEESRSIEAAVDLARSAGTVVVAAAGNLDVETLDFPAAYPPVIAVAGTDPDDRKAAFSDFGAAVDLAAPAVGILSTYWDGTYAVWSGTSMASPLVAGTAALLYGLQGPRSVGAATSVEEFITAGAEPLAAIDPVYGALLGAGRLSVVGSVGHVWDSGDPGDPVRTRVGH